MKDKQRAETIEEVIRLAWDSLESHLPYTYEKHHDSADFHKQCVKEYAEMIRLLTELY